MIARAHDAPAATAGSTGNRNPVETVWNFLERARHRVGIELDELQEQVEESTVAVDDPVLARTRRELHRADEAIERAVAAIGRPGPTHRSA